MMKEKMSLPSSHEILDDALLTIKHKIKCMYIDTRTLK